MLHIQPFNRRIKCSTSIWLWTVHASCVERRLFSSFAVEMSLSFSWQIYLSYWLLLWLYFLPSDIGGILQLLHLCLGALCYGGKITLCSPVVFTKICVTILLCFITILCAYHAIIMYSKTSKEVSTRHEQQTNAAISRSLLVMQQKFRKGLNFQECRAQYCVPVN